MAREDRKYGHEKVDKKNDSQKKQAQQEKEESGYLDKTIQEYFIKEARHGEGKGENKERYEKRDNDKFQEKRRDEFAEKVQEERKHSKKY